MKTVQKPSYGLLAEFAQAQQLLAAARAACVAGYRGVEAYAPFHVEGLAETLPPTRETMPDLGLAGGLAGGSAGFGLQYWSWVIDYPLNLGGRAHLAWPTFMLVTFEMAVLGAALFLLFGLLIASRLPRLHHPVFDAPDFERVTQDRFFLCIRASDPGFDPAAARQFLERLGPLRVSEV